MCLRFLRSHRKRDALDVVVAPLQILTLNRSRVPHLLGGVVHLLNIIFVGKVNMAKHRRPHTATKDAIEDTGNGIHGGQRRSIRLDEKRKRRGLGGDLLPSKGRVVREVEVQRLTKLCWVRSAFLQVATTGKYS